MKSIKVKRLAMHYRINLLARLNHQIEIIHIVPVLHDSPLDLTRVDPRYEVFHVSVHETVPVS